MHSPGLVVLSGDLDVYSVATACRALDVIDGPAVVDISGVRLLSAAALTEFARVAKRAGYGKVTLAGPQPHVRYVLDVAHFERLFRIVDAVPDES